MRSDLGLDSGSDAGDFLPDSTAGPDIDMVS